MSERQVKIEAVEFEGYAVTVEVNGNIDEYAISFLHIFNNVKSNASLHHITSNYGNCVTVYCNSDVVDELVSYLRNFGKVQEPVKALLYEVDGLPDYEIDDYDGGQLLVPYTF